MYFVADPERSCQWWALHVGGNAEAHRGNGGFCWFDLDGVEVGFHPADNDKNPLGGSTVVYYAVSDLNEYMQRLVDAGCRPHRGPLELRPGRRICQVVDPFGIVIGLDGP